MYENISGCEQNEKYTNPQFFSIPSDSCVTHNLVTNNCVTFFQLLYSTKLTAL